MSTNQNNGPIKYVYTKVTPEMAKNWLKKSNKVNRVMRPSTVAYYIKMIKNWKVTHQCIAFNKKGELVDGQHRLEAVAQSDETVSMYVAYYLQDTKDALDLPLDNGLKRTDADLLGLDHRLVAMIKKGFRAVTSNARPTPDAQLAFADHFGIPSTYWKDAGIIGSAAFRAAFWMLGKFNDSQDGYKNWLDGTTTIPSLYNLRQKYLLNPSLKKDDMKIIYQVFFCFSNTEAKKMPDNVAKLRRMTMENPIFVDVKKVLG